MKLLLYCTKSKWQLFRDIITGKWLIDKIKNRNAFNGKIVAECDFEVEWYDTYWDCMNFKEKNGLVKSCLTDEELFDYLKGKSEFYAINIKNLHIFDKPRKLEYYHKEPYLIRLLQTAPQNMCYCYEYKGIKRNDVGEYDDIFEKCVVISIHSEYMCPILNGEKTAEIRKVVLKEML